jgi:hypothetical protein
MAEQSFQSHTRWVPAFHFFVLPVLLLNAGWSIYKLIRLGFSGNALVYSLTAVALFLLAFHARLFALSVQDRVIRLEERQRLSHLLPDDLKPRISELTVGQLVAMRFASDEELPGLARKVLNDKVADRKSVKQLVKNWRPDNLRA